MNNYALAIHGGAGTIDRQALSPELERVYRAGLEEALQAGEALLARGAPAEEAVVAAVQALEDNPLFNAGRGSVFTNTGEHEMDACLMRGHDLAAGAVAGVKTIKNPILAAQAVLRQGQFVLLAATGAEAFAREQGLETAPPEYFHTEHRRAQWMALQHSQHTSLDHSGGFHDLILKDTYKGTVGAVALDQHGQLAAATSTGGLTNKKFGRVGDSPIVGAGTYANAQVAISCTGTGEVFIKHVVAHELASLMKHGCYSLEDAARRIIIDQLGKTHPDSGGLIAVDNQGHLSLVFNSSGMYRGWVRQGETAQVAIF